MNIQFQGGSGEQRQLFVAATRLLLNYDLDNLDADLLVEFSADPNPDSHNEYAATRTPQGNDGYQLGVSDAHILIREDAPVAAIGGVPFFNEAVAHELGHAIFAMLSSSARLSIVALLGLETDDLDVLNDQSVPWADRPIEGIAETFKEAFLPERMRLHPNRTNQQIQITDYAEFRRVFREGIAGSTTGGLLKYLHPDGTNVYETEDPGSPGEGTAYEPVVSKQTSTRREVTYTCQYAGDASENDVVQVRLRPYDTDLYDFVSPVMSWNVRDMDSGTNFSVLYSVLQGPTNTPKVFPQSEPYAGADYFDLGIVGRTTGPYGLGLIEGDLRGINIVVPGDMSLRLNAVGTFVFEPPGGGDDTSLDADMIAAIQSMVEGAGEPLTFSQALPTPRMQRGGARLAAKRVRRPVAGWKA